jgi:uncharacterized protein
MSWRNSILNNDLVKLVWLQKLDNKIAQLKRITDDAPIKLQEVEAEIASDEERVRQSLALEQDMIKRRRELEREVSDADGKIKENQVRQLKVKTNEEYRALLKENEFLRKTNSAREDEALELMDNVEKLSKENIELKAWLEERRIAIAARIEHIKKGMAAGLVEVKKLEEERNTMIKDIPKQSMALYNRIYTARNGRAVVAIIDGVCQECHLQIPPQHYNELQKNETVLTCPNCMRIVFWGDHDDFRDMV